MDIYKSISWIFELESYTIFELDTQNGGANMENLHTFTKYISGDELQRSNFGIIKNIIILVATAVKCTILGIYITIKSILRYILPFSSKDIQYQVALVRFSELSFNLHYTRVFYDVILYGRLLAVQMGLVVRSALNWPDVDVILPLPTLILTEHVILPKS